MALLSPSWSKMALIGPSSLNFPQLTLNIPALPQLIFSGKDWSWLNLNQTKNYKQSTVLSQPMKVPACYSCYLKKYKILCNKSKWINLCSGPSFQGVFLVLSIIWYLVLRISGVIFVIYTCFASSNIISYFIDSLQ